MIHTTITMRIRRNIISHTNMNIHMSITMRKARKRTITSMTMITMVTTTRTIITLVRGLVPVPDCLDFGPLSWHPIAKFNLLENPLKYLQYTNQKLPSIHHNSPFSHSQFSEVCSIRLLLCQPMLTWSVVLLALQLCFSIITQHCQIW